MTTRDTSSLDWTKLSGLELLQKLADGQGPVPEHARQVGMSIAAAEPGRVELAWRPPRTVGNAAGAIHGGYLAMVLDDAAGLACATMGDRFRPMLTLSLHIDYLRPARPGARYAVAGRVVHAGRTRLVADAEILDGDGRPVARATGSFSPNMAFDPTTLDPPTAEDSPSPPP
jgi:uncharacterized protein (TIGR00369 family)